MDSTNFRRIEAHLNAERLNAYRRDGADDETALDRYLLNMALCKSLYGPLQMAEVTLRNALHDALADKTNPELLALTRMLDRFSETRSLGLAPWREKLSHL